MSALRIVHRNFAEFFQLVHQLTSYALLYVSAFVSPRAKTAATVVALSSQLAYLQKTLLLVSRRVCA